MFSHDAKVVCYDLWDDDHAQNILLESCRSENLNIALFTINLLMYIDHKEPFINTLKEVHELPGRDYNVKAACMDFLGSLKLVPNNYEFRE